MRELGVVFFLDAQLDGRSSTALIVQGDPSRQDDTGQGQKQNVGATRSSNAAGRRRGTNGQEEVWAQVRSSPQGEQAEPPPQEHRNKPSCCADLACGGGETEWDILKVG